MLNRSRESGHLVLFLILEKRLLFTIMYDVCVYSLSLSFLQPSSKPCWFSKQLRESCIPGVRSQGWGAYYVVQTPPHKEHSQACGISLLFCVFTSSVGPNVIASPPLWWVSVGIFLYRSHCRRAILLVPRSISARVILYIFIALMCLRVSAASSYSVIMITLSAIISLNKLSVSFSLSSSETQIICKLFLFVVSHRSYGTSLVAQMMKILSAMQDIRVLSLGWDDPLEKGMGTHSSVLVWRIPWTEEPRGL